jgi:ferric-dicitrate binding protein FerR (iron transport regulator)
MDYSTAISFVEQFASGNNTPDAISALQHAEFIAWLNTASPAELEGVMDVAMSKGLALPASPKADAFLVRRIEAALDQYELEQQGRVGATPIRRLLRFCAAAAILLSLAGAGWWLNARRQVKSPAAIAAQPKPDITPGRNAAILTLSGGHQVVLDSIAEDTILTEGAAIVANSHGHLAYNPGNTPMTEVTYNTLSTARGNQYQLILPDGSKVWLNAASSITYPTAFRSATRQVTITGEAYFEVAAKASQPFHVKSAAQDITVLGTSFNINTYPDESASTTTLVDGSVRVSKGPDSRVLRPGQQARVQGELIRLVNDADLEQALAWKNGLVKLTGADIREVMRQVSRWYDVDVQFEGNLDKAVFTGVVSRQQNLSKLLQVLEATGSVHCTLDPTNKKIIVKP